MPDQQFIEALRNREFENYLVEWRNERTDSYSGWKDRVIYADALVGGDWTVAFPNQIKANERPMVQNTAEVMARDVPRLVGEQNPTMRSVAKGDTEAARNRKQLREAVAETHWSECHADELEPLWTMDLLVAGAAFSNVSIHEDCDYPVVDRIDPRLCLPDIYNGKLIDLIVRRNMKLRQVKAVFPDFDLPTTNATDNTEVEVIEYYGPDMTVRAIGFVRGGKLIQGQTWIVDASKHDKKFGCMAQMVKLPTHDGAFRGMIEQVGNSLLAKNKVVRLMTQYADQQVAAPFVAKGILNPGDKPGPNTVYIADGNVPDAGMSRVQPAGGSPQLFALVGLLDSNERGQIAYPEARQGTVSQSIASASFVAATQGQLSSVVRDVQKYIGKLREQATSLSFKLDEEFLNYEKPVMTDVPIGKDNRYTPKDTIEGVYKVRTVYGAGAGLDRLNADVRLLQFHGAGAISKETMRENIEFVGDPEVEASRWERDQVENALLQKFVGDPNAPFDVVLAVFEKMHSDGLSFADAVKEARAEAAKQAEAQAQPGLPQPGAPGQEVPPQVAEGAVEAGATSPEQLGGAGEVEFNPPPLEQIFVGR